MRTALSILLLTLTLAGCGQTGPLYMPDNERASERYDPQGAYEDDSAGDSDAAGGGAEVTVPDSGDSPTTTSPGASGVSATAAGAPAAPEAAE